MVEKIAPISSRKIASTSSYECHKCGSRGDVFDLGKLLCAICYLSKHDPKRVDKLKRQNRLTR